MPGSMSCYKIACVCPLVSNELFKYVQMVYIHTYLITDQLTPPQKICVRL